MSKFERYGTHFRKLGLADFHRDFSATIDDIYTKIGSRPPQFIDTLQPLAPAKPSPASFSVGSIVGVGFQVQVVNPENIQPASVALARAKSTKKPNAPLTPLFHNLQSATDTNFNSASNLVDHGISNHTLWSPGLVGTTRYWRIRSSFDGQNWNPWQLFAGPSGPIAVTA